MSRITFTQLAAPPTVPATGKALLYIDTAGHVKVEMPDGSILDAMTFTADYVDVKDAIPSNPALNYIRIYNDGDNLVGRNSSGGVQVLKNDFPSLLISKQNGVSIAATTILNIDEDNVDFSGQRSFQWPTDLTGDWEIPFQGFYSVEFYAKCTYGAGWTTGAFVLNFVPTAAAIYEVPRLLTPAPAGGAGATVFAAYSSVWKNFDLGDTFKFQIDNQSDDTLTVEEVWMEVKLKTVA